MNIGNATSSSLTWNLTGADIFLPRVRPRVLRAPLYITAPSPCIPKASFHVLCAVLVMFWPRR